VLKVIESLESQLLHSAHGRTVKLASKRTLIEAKWFGDDVSEVAASRMPDVFAIAVGRTALYHRDFAPAKSLNMIGQHGSVSAEELSIPLLKLAALAG
jgi:hypothetical protein